MSARYDSVRAILDDLFGPDRNLPFHMRTNKDLKFTDESVCKYYIAGYCAHDLFKNTKMDLGPCPNLHDEGCRLKYMQVLDRVREYPEIERTFINQCRRLVADMDRRIRRSQERLGKKMELTDADRRRVDELHEEIAMLQADIERLGEAGNVDATAPKVSALQRAKEELERLESHGRLAAVRYEQKLVVCEICGAIQAENESVVRVYAHNEGKLHVGFTKIRKLLADYRVHHPELFERDVYGSGPMQTSGAYPPRTSAYGGDRGGAPSRDSARSSDERAPVRPARDVGYEGSAQSGPRPSSGGYESRSAMDSRSARDGEGARARGPGMETESMRDRDERRSKRRRHEASSSGSDESEDERHRRRDRHAHRSHTSSHSTSSRSASGSSSSRKRGRSEDDGGDGRSSEASRREGRSPSPSSLSSSDASDSDDDRRASSSRDRRPHRSRSSHSGHDDRHSHRHREHRHSHGHDRSEHRHPRRGRDEMYDRERGSSDESDDFGDVDREDKDGERAHRDGRSRSSSRRDRDEERRHKRDESPNGREVRRRGTEEDAWVRQGFELGAAHDEPERSPPAALQSMPLANVDPSILTEPEPGAILE